MSNSKSKERLNLYITVNLKEQIQREAEETGLNMSTITTIALLNYFKEKEAFKMSNLMRELKDGGYLEV